MTDTNDSIEEVPAAKAILVVEDDRDVGAFLVQAITEETPYQALLVTDGFQALKLVREVTPALVLLDYHLPGMDGIALFDRLHATKGLEALPTIIASADVPPSAVAERHLPSLRKPLNLDELLQTIERVLAESAQG